MTAVMKSPTTIKQRRWRKRDRIGPLVMLQGCIRVSSGLTVIMGSCPSEEPLGQVKF